MKSIEETQKQAKELGHCLCHLKFKCPCRVFKEQNKCKCAGDTSIDYKDWCKINEKDYE